MSSYIKNISLSYKELESANKIKKEGNFSEFIRQCLNNKKLVNNYINKCKEEYKQWSKEQRQKELKNLKEKSAK